MQSGGSLGGEGRGLPNLRRLNRSVRAETRPRLSGAPTLQTLAVICQTAAAGNWRQAVSSLLDVNAGGGSLKFEVRLSWLIIREPEEKHALKNENALTFVMNNNNDTRCFKGCFFFFVLGKSVMAGRGWGGRVGRRGPYGRKRPRLV